MRQSGTEPNIYSLNHLAIFYRLPWSSEISSTEDTSWTLPVRGKVITTPFSDFHGDDIKIWRYIHFLRYAVPFWNEDRPRVHPEENQNNLFSLLLSRTCHCLLCSLCIMLFSFPFAHFPSPLYPALFIYWLGRIRQFNIYLQKSWLRSFLKNLGFISSDR